MPAGPPLDHGPGPAAEVPRALGVAHVLLKEDLLEKIGFVPGGICSVHRDTCLEDLRCRRRRRRRLR